MKRMVVSDETLVLISTAFPNFKSLVLISCVGFSGNGLDAIATNCSGVLNWMKVLGLLYNIAQG